MDIQRLKDTILKKNTLDLNDDYGIEECWDIEVDILSKNIPEATNFLQTCSEDEFYWLSEIFPQLIEKTQSSELYNALCERNETLENQDYKLSNRTDLEFAKDALLH